jgi:hypothetical protein
VSGADSRLSPRGQVGLGGREQAFPLAGPLGSQERVQAGHQPLAGESRRGDLGQVLDVEQRQLQVPAADQLLDLRGAQRGDPVQLRGATSSRSRAAVSMPRSPTSTTRVSPDRSLTLSIWLATVAGSPVLPWKTSMATGMPSLLVSSP